MVGKTDNTSAYAAIATPTLLVYGELDSISPMNDARGVERAIGGAVTEVIVGAGHAPAQECPGLFNTAVHTFMRTARMLDRPFAGARRATA
jgi:pimeloyl-ACP methyl ester carboxylesterase